MPVERRGALVVGCSTGGVRALGRLFSAFPADFGWPILTVCHFGPDDIGGLCATLARSANLPVIQAEERMRPTRNCIHLAPSGYHLYVEPEGVFALSVDPKQCYSRPSIDVLFESAAWHYGAGLVGVILTGANDDGARGLATIRARGGLAVVQRPDEAEAPEMPRAAIDRAGADHVLPLDEIAPTVTQFFRKRRR